jgi:uncharacterized membrane protein
MTTRSAVLAAALLTLAALVYTLVLYPSLPERIPTHWNWQGEVDGWTRKGVGVFLPTGLMVLFLGLLFALPWLSPRPFGVETFRETFNYVMVATIALFAFLQWVTLQAALHPERAMGRVLIAGLFLFFALLGNVLGKVRRNFWIGVRTPWTLANDAVWIATHRLAARLFVALGLLGALLVLLGAPVGLALVLLLIVAFVPVIYSLVLYKRMEREGRA